MGLPPQTFGKVGSGATLSYVESSQSFKPSPVKTEGINSKNFPLSIQKSSTHKAQSKLYLNKYVSIEIKIGLHKKAASLMNSN